MSLDEAPLLAALRAGTPQLMLGVRSARTPEIVRIAHATGHHAIMVDLEHSSMSIDVAAQLCGAAGDLGLTAFVRIPEREYGLIGRLLDGGAHGIIAPRVESVAAAQLIADACRFPPRGHRSQVGMVPQLGMVPTPAVAMNPRLNRQVIVKILIESPAGIDAAPAIAELGGVDIMAFGANDYTSEIGVPGDYSDPRVDAAIIELARAARSAGKLAMLGGIAGRELLVRYLDSGYSPLFMTGTDTDLVFDAARVRADGFRALGDSSEQET